MHEIFTENDIEAEGASDISESLMINTSLTKLSLGCDAKRTNKRKDSKWIKNYLDKNIGLEGATKISESLKINTTLTELSLRSISKAFTDNNNNNPPKKQRTELKMKEH